MAEVKIGNSLIGEGQPCFIIAEIGINHNGDIDVAKRLIDLAKLSKVPSTGGTISHKARPQWGRSAMRGSAHFPSTLDRRRTMP